MPFRRYDPTVKAVNGLTVTTWGREKVGKTHFALTFPDPIYLFNFDFGFEPVAKKLPAKKEIYVSDFPIRRPGDPDEAEEILKAFEKDLDFALGQLQDRPTGTVVFDTAAELWKLAQLHFINGVVEKRIKINAQNKKPTDPDLIRTYPYDYGKANAWMAGQLRRVVQLAEEYGTNGVFINRCKQVYNDKGEPTGTYEYNGFGESLAITPIVLMLGKTQQRGEPPEFFARVQSCRYDFEQEGMEFADPTYETIKAIAGLE